MKKTMASILCDFLFAGAAWGGEYWPTTVALRMNYDNGSTITVQHYGAAGEVGYLQVRSGLIYSTHFFTNEDGDTYVLFSVDESLPVESQAWGAVTALFRRYRVRESRPAPLRLAGHRNATMNVACTSEASVD